MSTGELILVILIPTALNCLFIYLHTYFGEKGKNLATKEDIAAITRNEAEIRAEFSKLLQLQSDEAQDKRDERNRLHAMRIAAIDKRLQIHQEAYTLWHKLHSNVHGNNIHAVVIECQEWWIKNCLYLDAESRKAFYSAYHAANLHHDLLEGRKYSPDDEDLKESVKENWQTILDAPASIERGVALPPMKSDDVKPDPKKAGN